jgi:hypothetical protein
MLGSSSPSFRLLRPKRSERRTSVRVACNLETSPHLIAALGSDFFLARVRNISPEGISLVVSRSFDPGTVLSVDLIDKRTNHFSDTLQVQVLYALEHPSGEWILGGIFNRDLTADELKIFVN